MINLGIMQLTRDILKRSFWALPMSEVLDVLATSRNGLTDEAAEERQQVFGKNALPHAARLTKLRILLRQLKSPLLLLLSVAAAITFFLQDYKDALVILAAVIANVGLGFYQENKAEATLADLKIYIKDRARVLRNGQEKEIDAAELAPGDIIHISQGDRVPADARLIYINDLFIDESALTGESVPVDEKHEPFFKTGKLLRDRLNGD